MSIFINSSSRSESAYEPLIDILVEFPIGIIIIECESLIELAKSSKISFANEYARRLLTIPSDKDISTFLDNIAIYKEYSPFEVITLSLKDAILNIKSKSMAKVFISPSRELLYVKIKCLSSKILLSIDDLQEERRVIQSNFAKKVNYEYLLTLYHEINNPLNSLVASVNEIIQKAESITTIIKRITLLVLLIQFFLKNFILYFQVSMMMNSCELINESKSTFSLELLLKQIARKFETLFDYKKILYRSNTKGLLNKATTLNYFYFKTLIKIIFSYFYYILQKGLGLVVQCEEMDQSTMRLIFTNDMSVEVLSRSCDSVDVDKEEEDNTSTTEDELNQKNKIQTIDMILLTMTQLSSILNLKLNHVGSETITISLVIPYENDHHLFNEEDYTELSPNHHKVFRALDRSLSKFSLNDLENKAPLCINCKDKEEETSIEYNDIEDFKWTSIMRRKNTVVPALISNDKPKQREEIDRKRNKCCKKIHSVNHYTKKKKCPFLINGSPCLFDDRNLKQVFNLSGDFNDKQCTLVKNFSNISHKDNQWNSIMTINDKENQSNEKKVKFEYIKKEFLLHNSTMIKLTTHDKGNREDERKVNVIPTKKNTESLKNKYNDIGNISYKSIMNYLTTSLKPSITTTHKSRCLIPCQCNDVLIVDDEPFNLSCLTNILFKLKICTDTANDGKECLEKVIAKAAKNCSCSKSYYKLILLDILMPKVSGMEAAEEIMKYVQMNVIPQTISIIFISACIDKEKTIDDITKKLPLVKAFLPKPIKRTKIEELLKSYYNSDIDL